MDVKQPISIAYSPDTDDAFMVMALKNRDLDWGGFEFSFVKGDIQELNEAARKQVHDITALSLAAYPFLAEDYAVMPIGASVGDGYGPAVVVNSSSQLQTPADLKGKRIAVPGLMTSAYMSSQILFGPYEPEPMLFENISGAVLRGEVDAGILIHELQIDFASLGLRKVADLGKLWRETYEVPLPLGVNGIRRELGTETIAQLTDLLRKSVQFGLDQRMPTLKKAIDESKPGLDLDLGDRYIQMYVNQDSLDLRAEVRDAALKMFELGAAKGLCPKVNEQNWCVSS